MRRMKAFTQYNLIFRYEINSKQVLRMLRLILNLKKLKIVVAMKHPIDMFSNVFAPQIKS